MGIELTEEQKTIASLMQEVNDIDSKYHSLRVAAMEYVNANCEPNNLSGYEESLILHAGIIFENGEWKLLGK